MLDKNLKTTLLLIQQIRRDRPEILEELHKYKDIYRNLYRILLELLEKGEKLKQFKMIGNNNQANTISKILDSLRPELEEKPLKNKKISIIIPHRDNGQTDRQMISDWCIKRYKFMFPDAEIILSDCGKNVFSRGGSINKGVEQSTGNYIIITDNDYLFGQQLAKGLINNYKWTVCTTKENYYYINKKLTSEILQMPITVKLSKINFKNSIRENPFNMWGGIIAMPKKNFIKFDDSIYGYGYDDTIYYDCMRAFYGNPQRTNSLMYHLEHQRISGSIYMQRSYNNKAYYDQEWRPIRDNFEEVRKKCFEKGLIQNEN